MVKKIQQKERVNRILSICIIYALLLHDFVPFAQAISGTNDRPTYSAHWQDFSNEEVAIDESLPDLMEIESDMLASQDIDQEPIVATVNSGGPGQSEIVGSTANSGGNLVDKFSGDMSYSLPIMNVEGFPITLAYNPNVGMDQEASWVGLGWNISLGAINREMRGIPDDFKGDQVERTIKMLPNTVDGDAKSFNLFAGFGNPVALNLTGTDVKIGGKFPTPGANFPVSLSAGFSFSKGEYFNNYTGIGRTRSTNFTASLAVGLRAKVGDFGASAGASVSGGLGFTSDSQNGRGVSNSGSFNTNGSVGSIVGFNADYSAQRSSSVNSRTGIKTKSQSSGFTFGETLLVTYEVGKSYGSMRTFGVQTFVPRFASANVGTSDFTTTGFNGSLQYILAHAGGGGGKDTTGSSNSVKQYTNLYPAYGFNNHSLGQKNPKAMLDFNRDRTTGVSSETKILSFSAQTYDVYYCSAPGLSASYRPYRYDVVENHDPNVNSTTHTTGTVAEKNVNGGINMTGNVTAGYSQTNQALNGGTDAKTGGALNGITPFTGVNGSQTFDGKEYYLKTQGETKPTDLTMLDDYQGAQATSLEITRNGNNHFAVSGNLVNKNGTTTMLPAQNFNLDRQHSSVHYREKKIGEMDAPEVHNAVDCGSNEHIGTINGSYQFITDEKMPHHTGEIEAIDPSGMRYKFGIPVYNYEQNEISFSASGRVNETDFHRTGLIGYVVGDNSVNNTRGRNQSYEKTRTPAFASTYLLTEMLTPDYIDRTGNGLTADDQGNYFKLDYTNPYNGIETDGVKEDIWKWRMPMCSDVASSPLGLEYSENLAYFSENSESDQWDDIANYLYGEKEVWYAASVESKNMIAYFCLEDREDQYSMKDENGGLDLTKPGKLLKKILLFAKNDLEQGVQTAKPLQIVEFEYDYSLCQKYVGNSNTYSGGTTNSGKLTLKAVYSYTGESNENKTMPIEFDYGQNDPEPIIAAVHNPEFKFNCTDRWGCYKPNDPAMPNYEFPYATQDSWAEQHIQAWKLKAVNVIGGARTEFTYATDDYAFVQDKRAMRMFNIAGMSSYDDLTAITGVIDDAASLATINSDLRNLRNPSNKRDYYNVVYFKLDEPIPTSVGDVTQEITNQYFKNENGVVPPEFYFKMHSRLDNRSENDDLGYEFVESTAKLTTKYGVNFCGPVGQADGAGNYNYGWFIVKEENISQFWDEHSKAFGEEFVTVLENFLITFFGDIFSQKVNPLIISNWEYARANVPCAVYGDIDYTASTATDFCDYNLDNDDNVFGKNLYKKFNEKKYGLRFDQAKSIVRLFEPDNVKVGGGCKVESVTTYDNWEDYSDEELNTASYTYNYFYGPDRKSSYGVASYEPQVGNNENPFYQLIAYSYERKKLPDARVYQKDPWGELAYPGARVGYEKVTSQLYDGDVVGKVVDEFHTLRYHRTIPLYTPINRQTFAGDGALEQDHYFSELYGMSQGFYVETSDFHGKPMRSEVYGKIGELISTSEIEYYETDEQIKFIEKDGSITLSPTPRDVDIHADSWKSNIVIDNTMIGETFSIGFTMYGFFPFPLIRKKKSDSYFTYQTTAEAFTFNKVVHHYAVPKSIHTSYLGSSNTAKNIYFDEKSGNVIASSLKDEYDDELFSLAYPAHWYYDNFNGMVESDGAFLLTSEVTGVGNVIQVSSIHGIELNEGDHLIIDDGVSVEEAWVLEEQAGDYYLIDEDGVALTGITWPAAIRIERTGVKNILGAQMMSVATKKELTETAGKLDFPTDVLSSSAVKFSENKQVACIPFAEIAAGNQGSYPAEQLEPGEKINPYLTGTKGNFRMLSSFAFQEERDESEVNDVRQDGEYLNYQPFYAYNTNGWYAIDEAGHPDNLTVGDFNDWRKLGVVDQFDEFGKPLQSTDQIDISSSVVYGMNNDLKLVQKATAVNARATEIGFDGFEDYNYFTNDGLDYLNYGFSLKPTLPADIVSTEKHSGRYSLAVTGQKDYNFLVETAVLPTAHVTSGEYSVQDCDCIQGFAPAVGEKYFFSTWVREDTKGYPFGNSEVVISSLNALGIPTVLSTNSPSGAVIDGWQKIEGEYTLPAGSAAVRISLKNESTTSYFDDFRTHPFLAGMTTTVYDQKNLLPMAQHDGYNYTTFYNYDENFQLVRVRVETIEGIKTISESEMGSYRKQQ